MVKKILLVAIAIFIITATIQIIMKTCFPIKNTVNDNSALISDKQLPTDYVSEEVLICPTFSELEENPELENVGCACGDELFMKDDIDIAIQFLKNLKIAVKQNDKELFAKTLVYPLEINYSNESLKINTIEDFYIYNLNLKKLFNTSPSDRLFWNYEGFSYGNIRFYVKDKKIVELKFTEN